MGEVTSFVKLDRGILTWRWYKDPNTARVFIHLLLTANIEDHDFEQTTIHRGEVATSYESIASKLSLSVQNVRTAINHLKSTGEVTSRICPKFQVISIVCFDKYQCQVTGKVTVNQQAANRQLTTIKEVKNIYTKVSSCEDGAPSAKAYCEIVDHLNAAAGTHFKASTDTTQRLIHARLADGFTVDDFKAVIDSRAAEWKDDAKMSIYLRPQTLFGSKFEAYLQAAHKSAPAEAPHRVFVPNGEVDELGNAQGHWQEVR